MVDPRITRTERATEEAVITLASTRPISRISVSELAEAAGVSRATFYNRYATPLDVLTRVLRADLRARRAEDEERRSAGTVPPMSICVWPPGTSSTTSSAIARSTATRGTIPRTTASTTR